MGLCIMVLVVLEVDLMRVGLRVPLLLLLLIGSILLSCRLVMLWWYSVVAVALVGCDDRMLMHTSSS